MASAETGLASVAHRILVFPVDRIRFRSERLSTGCHPRFRPSADARHSGNHVEDPHGSGSGGFSLRTHLIWLLLVCTMGLGISLPGTAEATKFAGAFMADGGGARALGMGSAFVAVADDPSAAFFNPAGLVDAQRPELMVMHSERFGDLVDRDYVSYVHPLSGEGWSGGAFAVSVIHLAVDDIPITSQLKGVLDTDGSGVVEDDEVLGLLDPAIYDQIQYETDRELALMLSYARRAGSWQWGGNLKFVRQGVADFSSFGIGVDLGLLRRDWIGRLDFGVKLQDATQTYLSWDTGRNETISPVLVPGLSYDWLFESLQLSLTASGAFEMHFDNRTGDVDEFEFGSTTANLMLGIEAMLARRAQIRFGTRGNSVGSFQARNLTWGLGLVFNRFRVDYAYAGDILEIDENTHRISLGLYF